MPTLDSLRRQIETATDLSSVVTTMKTLAAVSIHQYERAVEALSDYTRTIELGFEVALTSDFIPHETEPWSSKTAAIVFGSDQGMCGQFNEEVASFLETQVKQQAIPKPSHLLVVGVRVEGQLLDVGWEIDNRYEVPSAVSDITNLVQEMLPRIERLRHETGISRLQVFHNRPTSASSFEARRLQLLPLDTRRLQCWRDEPWQSRSLPMFVTDRHQLISQLIQHYLFVSLFRACAESLASENASRIAAMQAAENNIEERLDELHTSFNQLRQTAITEELLDVVTGFEALSQTREKRDGKREGAE